MVSISKGESTADLQSDGSVGISPSRWFVHPHFLTCRKRSCPALPPSVHEQFYSVNSCGERYDKLGLSITYVLQNLPLKLTA